MKFRILVKQNPGGIPVYYPQFRCWGIWFYYLPAEREMVLKHHGYFFRVCAERFLQQQHDACLKQGSKSIISWKPYQ